MVTLSILSSRRLRMYLADTVCANLDRKVASAMRAEDAEKKN